MRTRLLPGTAAGAAGRTSSERGRHRSGDFALEPTPRGLFGCVRAGVRPARQGEARSGLFGLERLGRHAPARGHERGAVERTLYGPGTRGVGDLRKVDELRSRRPCALNLPPFRVYLTMRHMPDQPARDAPAVVPFRPAKPVVIGLLGGVAAGKSAIAVAFV